MHQDKKGNVEKTRTNKKQDRKMSSSVKIAFLVSTPFVRKKLKNSKKWLRVIRVSNNLKQGSLKFPLN